jgi:hypothetical protein
MCVADRAAAIRAERGGGSIPSELLAKLRDAASEEHNKLAIIEEAEVLSMVCNCPAADASSCAHGAGDTNYPFGIEGAACCTTLCLSNSTMLEADVVILATGMEVNFAREPLFQTLLKTCNPQRTLDGKFPALDAGKTLIQYHPSRRLMTSG